ncbi:MAG: MATE family efflux transporter, partial [Flectobacillus sp.]|nr:MATE family efflux transporter [Flectobacillus sp.]
MIILSQLKHEVSSTIKLALPIITGQVGIMLMGFTDTLQVGQMKVGGVEALAASADANGIYINIAIIGYICLQIVSPMVAKTFSNNNTEERSQLLLASCLVATVLSLLCGLIIWLVGQHLELLDQPAEIRGITQSFLAYITISIFPSFLFSAFKGVTDGLSRTKIGM